jgi:hypothetical protein
MALMTSAVAMALGNQVATEVVDKLESMKPEVPEETPEKPWGPRGPLEPLKGQEEAAEVPSGFKYNSEAVDTRRDRIVQRAVLNLNLEQQIQRAMFGEQDIYVTKTVSFGVKFLDVSDRYILPRITTDAAVQDWKAHLMTKWQNQFNFAVWCATAGCGIGVFPQLLGSYSFAPEGKFLARAVYRFAVNISVRRVLKEMDCPLPQDSEWNPLNNLINMHQYENICNEFFINPHTSWVIGNVGNWGLGQMRQRVNGAATGDDHLAGETCNPSFHFFGAVPKSGGVHIDHIAQEGDEPKIGWAQFIPPTSVSLTQPGRVRINQAIRSYCWAILVAQDETREPIVGPGSNGAAQRRFTELIEEACVQRGGVEFAGTTGSGTTQIDYERVLQKARSKLDFCVGEGLYLIPSDMTLHDLAGNYNGYNNQLKVAPSGLGLGENANVNLERAQGAGKKVSVQAPASTPTSAPTPTPALTPAPVPTPKKNTALDDHNELKAAIVIGAALGYGVYKYYSLEDILLQDPGSPQQ